jgi:hypothetical protein
MPWVVPRGASHVSPLGSRSSADKKFVFCAFTRLGVGPSCFPIWDRHFDSRFPLYRTLAKCAICKSLWLPNRHDYRPPSLIVQAVPCWKVEDRHMSALHPRYLQWKLDGRGARLWRHYESWSSNYVGPVGNPFWKLPRKTKGIVLLGTTYGEELLRGVRVSNWNCMSYNTLPPGTDALNTHTSSTARLPTALPSPADGSDEGPDDWWPGSWQSKFAIKFLYFSSP